MPMATLLQASLTAFEPGGALARHLPTFVCRPSQQRLAAAVAQTIVNRQTLLAEAGTGTGKTFAYLVPILLADQKTILSTGTRTLQDQLFHRDLPHIQQALAIPKTVVMLKGRANYLCRYRFTQVTDEWFDQHPGALPNWQKVLSWSQHTQIGDLSELGGLAEDAAMLAQITSTAENCLGNQCPFWDQCCVVQARQRAQSADIVIINHHVLLADIALRQQEFGELLPTASTYVIDEAHLLPELAGQFLGEALSSRHWQHFIQDTLVEIRQVPALQATMMESLHTLQLAVVQLQQSMQGLPERGTQMDVLNDPQVCHCFEGLIGSLQVVHQGLTLCRQTSAGLDTCTQRANELLCRVRSWFQAEPPPLGGDQNQRDEHIPQVCWYERGFGGSVRYQRTPLDCSQALKRYRERVPAAWIFTSATLTINGDFTHVSRQLGVTDPITIDEPSPFNWAGQALCYLPSKMPEPQSIGYGQAVARALLPVLDASLGRAFFLFTSHRTLQEALSILKASPWPLFVQGQASHAALLAGFRASGNGVLLGLSSFRQGVDVVGEGLSVVVLDKLPFQAPDNPVFQARLQRIQQAGGNPFWDEQLPQAVMAFKQGIGRLIRSETDRGVLVLCDRRLHSRAYGRMFLRAMPPLPQTQELVQVQHFFGHLT